MTDGEVKEIVENGGIKVITNKSFWAIILGQIIVLIIFVLTSVFWGATDRATIQSDVEHIKGAITVIKDEGTKISKNNDGRISILEFQYKKIDKKLEKILRRIEQKK